MNLREISRRLNYLDRVEKMREMYKSLQDGGRTDVWIHKNHIGPFFNISLGTMRKMLTIRISHERKLLDEIIREREGNPQEEKDPNQLELF